MKPTSNYDQLDSGLDVPTSPMNYNAQNEELNKLPFPCDSHTPEWPADSRKARIVRFFRAIQKEYPKENHQFHLGATCYRAREHHIDTNEADIEKALNGPLTFTLSDLLWTALACLVVGIAVGVVWK